MTNAEEFAIDADFIRKGQSFLEHTNEELISHLTHFDTLCRTLKKNGVSQ